MFLMDIPIVIAFGILFVSAAGDAFFVLLETRQEEHHNQMRP